MCGSFPNGLRTGSTRLRCAARSWRAHAWACAIDGPTLSSQAQELRGAARDDRYAFAIVVDTAIVIESEQSVVRWSRGCERPRAGEEIVSATHRPTSDTHRLS